MNPWRIAVDRQRIEWSLDCTSEQCDPNESVRELVDWVGLVSTDPNVSEAAQALIERGRSMIREGYEAIATDLARKIDALLTEALDRKLGRGAWSMQDLRLTEVTRMGDDRSTFYLDNSPILTLEFMKMDMEVGRLVARRRVLWMTP